jgi:hypothetical protein
LTVLVRSVVVASLAAAVLAAAAAVPAQASAASSPPCWKQVINDWFDGRIDRVYPLRCYREAIARLPEDVEVYSDAEREINAAMLAAARAERSSGGSPTATGPDDPAGGAGGPGSPGAGGGPGSGGGDDGSPGAAGEDEGFVGDVLNLVGPRNADSIPLPLLVLAGIALLLLAAAAASFVARRVQARRVPVAQSPTDGSPRS